ncbi:MAG: hypothetical protein KDK48_06590, partial [Chlamydiia bacterium]|nr:hypothetical protein [Chlamydiia bacterium]
PESARPYFEELGYKKMIFKKYFRKFTTVFRRMGFDEKYIDFAKERLPEPTRLRLIHGNLGFGHTLFHEGKVRFFNFTQSYFAEPELDWGKFYFREGVSDEAVKEAAALLDLDFDKIVYYAYLWAMQKLSVTRKYDPKRRKEREERFLAQLELLHKKLLK